MFDIICHQGNTNQTHDEILLTPTRMTRIKKITASVDKDVKKNQDSDGNIKWADALKIF